MKQLFFIFLISLVAPCQSRGQGNMRTTVVGNEVATESAALAIIATEDASIFEYTLQYLDSLYIPASLKEHIKTVKTIIQINGELNALDNKKENLDLYLTSVSRKEQIIAESLDESYANIYKRAVEVKDRINKHNTFSAAQTEYWEKLKERVNEYYRFMHNNMPEKYK